MHIIRIAVYILVVGILLSFLWHWFLLIRRASRISNGSKLLSFLQSEGRFYNIQLFICVITLIVAVWSHNHGRSFPEHVDYAPNAKWELRLWDQTGAWDIRFGTVEMILLGCCLWALTQSVRVDGQFKLLWSVRSKLGLETSEYHFRA